MVACLFIIVCYQGWLDRIFVELYQAFKFQAPEDVDQPAYGHLFERLNKSHHGQTGEGTNCIEYVSEIVLLHYPVKCVFDYLRAH